MITRRMNYLSSLWKLCRWRHSTVSRYSTKNSNLKSTRNNSTSTIPAVNNIHNNLTNFKPKRVLVLSKITRYEFEKRRHPNLDEKQLATLLAERGSDYQGLIYHHQIHAKCLNMVTDTLKRHNIETRVVQRFNYDTASIEWADMIIATGGDGTFLLGASRIQDSSKLIIGVNSDPTRSEGYLCLPAKYSTNLPRAFDQFLRGRFRWNWRQRIRITLTGEHAFEPPLELHDSQLTYPEYRFMDCIQEHHKLSLQQSGNDNNNVNKKRVRVLPVLALNEVFIGESLSSRVSYYEISIDNGPRVKQKSSGVTICTGTGSSSWYFNINKLTQQCVTNLLKIVKEESDCKMAVSPDLVQRILTRFNNSLYFDSGELKMAYTIRDPVVNGTVYTSTPRGFANRIEIKSRCFNACLVIDGGLSFVFNDGATALFEIYPEDALRSITLTED